MNKKRPKNIGKVLSFLLSAGAVVLILGFGLRTAEYSKVYSDSPEKLVSRPNQNTYLTLIETKEDDKIQRKYSFFSGTDLFNNIPLGKESRIYIDKKIGEAKVLIVDEEGKIIEADQENRNLKSGKYDVVIVGKYFFGTVEIKSEGI